MVTKKRRRSQLAKAGAQRQELRRAERARRRKRRQMIVTAVVLGVLVVGLVTWIVLHARDAGSASAAARPGAGDYASLVQEPKDVTTTGGLG